MDKKQFSKSEVAEIDALLSRLGVLANQRAKRELQELERLEASARSELAACARRRARLLGVAS